MLNDKLKFPAPIHPGATIAVTAPSTGVGQTLHSRLDSAIQHLRNQGFAVKEGQCLRHVVKGASGSKEARAEEFMKFWLDESVSAIIPPWGGVFAIDILPLLDWNLLERVPPKWLLGYSDISTLTFSLTLRAGIVTAHGTNLMEMQARQSDPLTVNCLQPLMLTDGDSITQRSGTAFQVRFPKEFDAPFQLTEKVEWKTSDGKPVRMSGRIIGGCLDTLSTLVGTPFAVSSNLSSQDGLLFYLENAEFSPTDQYRYLWTLKQAGWFKQVSGFLIGRSAGKEETNSDYFQYENLLEDFFRPLGIPIVYDMDIGHVVPNMTLLNGAFTEVHADGKGAGFIQQWRR